MNTRNKITLTITILCALLFVSGPAARGGETWIDHTNNAQLSLSDDGLFEFANATTRLQGSYRVQGNLLVMQDSQGNYYQYTVQTYSTEQMVLMDQTGSTFTYVPNRQAAISNTPVELPWQNAKYTKVLFEQGGHQWKERDNQLYVEFLQLLIGQRVTVAEVDSLRQDFIREFKEDPATALNDVKALETTMTQVYSLNNVQAVAMVKEEMSAIFYRTIQQKPEMNDYAFVKVLHRYVRILSIDQTSNLSLSNQDVDGYLNYLQFQAMVSGQNYQISPQDRMTMHVKLANEFNSYSVEQKQTLAFASFFWNVLANQWAGLTAVQQQQYVAQVQAQMNVQNANVNAGEFWNNSNNNSNSSYDINALETQYRQEAAAKGMTLQQYLSYKQQDMAVNNQIFVNMQNSMTENHVMMLNMINQDSGYEYKVDYNDY